MMKKIVGFLLAALMIVLLIPVTVMADDGITPIDNLDGNIEGESDSDGANIDDYVSYQLNGGKLVFQGRECLISARFPYYSDRGPFNLPTSIGREWYVFDGWYENEDFTGEPLVTIPQGAHGPRKVWAKWNEYKGEYGKTPETPESSDNPETGDNNTPGLFVIFMIVSLCIIVDTTMRVKKKKIK